MTTIKTPEGRRIWVPVLSLALAAFIFVTTEVLPIGLLPTIAKDLGETEAFTGLLIAVYAWCVALFSLPITALTAKVARRKLLLILFAVFVLGHGLSALAVNFTPFCLRAFAWPSRTRASGPSQAPLSSASRRPP